MITTLGKHPKLVALLSLPLFALFGVGLVALGERWIAGLALLPLLIAAGCAWAWLISPAEDRRWMIGLFVVGALARWGTTYAIEVVWSSFESVSDGAAYGPHSAAIAAAWDRRGFVRYEDVVTVRVGAPGYVYLGAALYWVLGYNTIFIKLVNGLFGALAALYTVKIGERVFDKASGRFGGIITAVMPSMLLWTSQNLKDSLVLFLALWALWLGLQVLERPWKLGVLALVLIALSTVRTEIGVAIAVMVAATALWRPGGHLVRRAVIGGGGIIVLGQVLALLGYGFLGIDLVQRTISLEAIAARREATAYGGSAVATGADATSLLGYVQQLPSAIANYLLRPWPWEATGSTQQLLTIPETLLWYPLFALSLLGLVFALRTLPLRSMLLWAFTIGVVVTAAPQYGNLGTAYRHRVQLWPLFFLFAGYAWYQLRDREQASESAPSERALRLGSEQKAPGAQP